ncbi:MAG: hypothetical protein IJC98_04790 [Clostridia bacterium]|nr:hypothetical protein [Clostridia bacterium]
MNFIFRTHLLRFFSLLLCYPYTIIQKARHTARTSTPNAAVSAAENDRKRKEEQKYNGADLPRCH